MWIEIWEELHSLAAESILVEVEHACKGTPQEVGSLKGCINVGHIAEDRWGPPLVDDGRHAFGQAIHKGIEGSDWENCAITTKK